VSVPLLAVDGLSRSFGKLVVLGKLDLAVEAGGIHAIIGPNGAGKTTFFNLVTGALGPDAGHIRFEGREIGELASYRRTALGICRTFQNIRLFGSMTVLENVLLGLHCRTHGGLLSPLLGVPFRRPHAEVSARARAGEILELARRARADGFSGRERRARHRGDRHAQAHANTLLKSMS